ncbi:MAG: BTAD domain-containing putative transcriptional regulator, partial [Acidimicrobiia bacterium]
MLREASVASLPRDAAQAIAYAERLVALEPLDENHHVVLVRSLVAAGRRDEAERRVESCVTIFDSELDDAPTGALRDALATRRSEPSPAVTPASV